MYLLEFFLIVLFAYAVSALYELPPNEFSALKDLYMATKGENWAWKMPFVEYGYPWQFDPTVVENPCNISHRWQGVVCTSHCDFSQCYVESLQCQMLNLLGTSSIELCRYFSFVIFVIRYNSFFHRKFFLPEFFVFGCK